MKENGFSSLQTLLILFILSLSVLGLGTGISLTGKYFRKSESMHDDKQQLRTEVEAILKQMQNDPAPEADSLFDPVWGYIKSKSDRYVYIKLSDVSSRINPNWVRPQFLERTELKRFFINGTSPGSFTDYRHKNGYVMDIDSAYSKLLDKEALVKYFTPFSYANINTAYEFVLQDLYTIITGNRDGSEVFHTFLAHALSKKHIISEKEFSTVFNSNYTSLYPVISTLPEMNVNFIPEFLLKQVLSYPYGGKVIENSNSIYTTLLSIRDGKEITPSMMHSLITTEGLQERVFQHLGAKTWFWKVELATANTAAEAIIVCFPETEDLGSEHGRKKRYHCRLYMFSEFQKVDRP